MRAILFNDTSAYHKGCSHVVRYIHQELTSCGCDVWASIPSADLRKGIEDKELNMLIERSDIVVVNGEGTMHHNVPAAKFILKILRRALEYKKQAFLINTVWQEMTLDRQEIKTLQNTYISVRECLSQEALKKQGIKADVHLDLSYFEDIEDIPRERQPLAVGGFFRKRQYRPPNVNVVDIFTTPWAGVVNRLRYTDWFITGRHHEMYAAAKARCPFVAFSGNTWKNEGLIKTAGVDIPVGPFDIEYSEIPKHMQKCLDKKDEYTKLFDWMEKQPRFTFQDKIK